MASKHRPSSACISEIVSEYENSGRDNLITRRGFLKRTGGATASALIAMYLSEKALATPEGGSPPAGDSGTTTPPEPQKNWYLLCYKDPGTTGNGPYEGGDPDYEGEDAHDGGYPIRTFYKRKKTPFSGGERALFLEVRTKGPVQCARNASGDAEPAEEDLRSSINITDNQVWAGVTSEGGNTHHWLDFLEAAQVYDDFASGDPSLEEYKGYYNVAAETRFPIGAGTLSIDKTTGDVTYNPSQVVPCDGTDAYEVGTWHVDYRLQALGVVKPHILVQGVAATGEEANIKWNFGAEGENNGGKVVGGMEWTNTAAQINHTMQWQIWRAYRLVNPDGSEGPIVLAGEATPKNQVEVTAPASMERR